MLMADEHPHTDDGTDAAQAAAGAAPGPTRYLSHVQLADLVGMNKGSLYQLRRLDGGVWVLDPDVMIGDVAGWSHDRAVQWGKDIGRLLPDGSVNPAPPRRPDSTRDRWRCHTRRYLSNKECGETLGIGNMSNYFLRRRGSFIPAAVVVGKVQGWDENEVLQLGRRTGRLDEEGNIVRRGERGESSS